MSRPNPFDPNDGCGDGSVIVHPDGLADKIYNRITGEDGYFDTRIVYISESGPATRNGPLAKVPAST